MKNLFTERKGKLAVFKKLSDAEISELNRRRNNLEHMVPHLPQHVASWRLGLIDLSKERLAEDRQAPRSIAATSQGKKIRWRRSPKTRRLVFQVIPS